MDDFTKSLQADNARLHTELAQARAEAKKYRIAKKTVAEELNTLRADFEKVSKERETLETRLKAAPSELQKELDQLKGEIRTTKHKSAFEKVAKELKVRPEAVNDLWSLSGVKPETDVVDEEGLKGLISEAVQARPYLLQGETEEKPQQPPSRLQPGTGFGRGGEPKATRFTAEQLADPRWMFANQGKVAAAYQDGTAVLANGRA